MSSTNFKGSPVHLDGRFSQVVDKAPAFKLKDQNGKERTLEEFLKEGKVALVFYRSASW